MKNLQHPGLPSKCALGLLSLGGFLFVCPTRSSEQLHHVASQQPLFSEERQEWEKSRNEFQSAMNKNDSAQMAESARRLVALAQKIDDVNLIARSLNNQGIALTAQGDTEVNQKRSGDTYYREAAHAFERALALADQVTMDHLRDALLIRCNGGKGTAHYKLNEVDLTETHWLKSLKAAEDAHDVAFLPGMLQNLGSLYWGQKTLDKKTDFFKRQRALFNQEKLPECVAWCDYYLAVGSAPDQTIKMLKAAIRSADGFDPDQSSGFRATVLHALELAAGSEGLYEEVIDTCDLAEKVWQKRLQADPNTSVEDLAECRNNLARAYLYLGDLQAALNEFDEALRLKPSAPSNSTLWSAIERNRTLARIASNPENDSADFSRAEVLVKQSLQSQKTLTHTVNVGDVIIVAGIALRRGEEARAADHSAAAQKIFQEALAFLETNASPSTQVGSGALGLQRLFQGALLLECGKPQLASDSLTKAKENLEAVHNESALGFCLPLLAVAQDRCGLKPAADETFGQAVRLFERRQARVASPARMGPFQFVQASSLYADYAGFLARSNRADEAILMADRARARGLSSQALKILQTKETPTKEQEKLWTEPLTREELQKLVKKHPDTLFLHYNLGRDEASLFAFGDKAPVKRLPLRVRPLALAHQVSAWIKNLVLADQSSKEVILAKELGKTLLEPLYREGFLAAKKGPERWRRLVIIPDGALHNVPFAALTLPEPGTLRLVDRFPFTMSVSLRQLMRKTPPRPSKSGLLLISNPTEGAGKPGVATQTVTRLGSLDDSPLPPSVCKAADLIAHRYPGAIKKLAGKLAGEEEVSRLLPDYSVLVFLTHGHASEDQSGLASYLTLAPKKSGGENGRLEAGKILASPLSAQMALLIACETAQGRLAGGEGSQGLVWAFWAAGCPSVTASLWNMDSEVCGKFLLLYWEELRKGHPKDEALRSAIMKVREANSSPADWAGFQVYGNSQPLSEFAPHLR